MKRKPRSNRNPDLVFQLSNCRPKLSFAVECKWRYQSSDGRYPWAATYKRIVYNNYGEKLNIPIYIALGIGGHPDNPENAYLIPFRKIQYEDFFRHSVMERYSWLANSEILKSYIILTLVIRMK